MLDDINSEGGLSRNGQKRPRQADATRQPMADREVPLLQPAERRLSDAVHAWLDGELPESAARKADSKDVDFWKQLDEETSRRRHMRTPAQVQARIVASIPEGVPAVIRPWYERELVITPATAIRAGATVLVLAALIVAAVVYLAR
jgi:hypothetical protein